MSELSEIKEIVITIKAELCTLKGQLEERCAARGKAIENLKKEVFGNSKPGLKQVVHDNRQDIDAIKQRSEARSAFARPIVQRLIIVAILAAFSSLMMVVNYVQMSPVRAALAQQPAPNEASP